MPRTAPEVSAGPSLASARTNRAICTAEVGVPAWSLTTESSLLSLASLAMVFTKFFPAARINPRRPDNQARRARGKQKPFALGLAFSVDRKRIYWVRLAIRHGRAAIEHIVCREMDQGHVPRRRPAPHGFNRGGIDRVSQLAFGFRLVDGGVGAGVDDEVRIQGAEPLAYRFGTGQIEGISCRQNEIGQDRQLLAKRGPNLAPRRR